VETAKANAELEKAHAEIANANTVLERERSERLKLEAAIAPRMISHDEKTALVGRLKSFAGKKVRAEIHMFRM